MVAVDYREVKDWSDGTAVRKAIVIRPQECTREQLVNLANHLSRRYELNPVVVINIFDDEAAALKFGKQEIGDAQKDFAFAHWPARWVKSSITGLDALEIYPDCDHGEPELWAY